MQYRSKFLFAAALISTVGWAHLAFAADAAEPSVKAPKPVAPVPFFFINDNRLTYAYLPNGTSAGVTAQTVKQVYAFTHFDAWAYGTNAINLNFSKSDHADPAAPCPLGGRTGCAGNTEFYGNFRSTLGFNEIFNTKVFSVGPLHNVSFMFGADAHIGNSALAASKRVGVAGLQFAFDLPYKGFFNVSPLLYKEINHNAYLPAPLDGNLNFRETWAVETNYYMDLGFLPEFLPLSISGRATLIGPKGPGTSVPGTVTRAIEFFSEPARLTLDASKAVWGAKYSHFVDVWVAYRYWQNKFGLDHNNDPSCTGKNTRTCTESSLYTGVTVKF